MQAFDIQFRIPARHTCRVRIGEGAIDALVEDLAAAPPAGLLAVVSDSNVAPLHGRPLVRRLQEHGLRVELLEFPAGETSKTRQTKARLEDRLFGLGAQRELMLIAVGGGVTGDLVGFLAATWHRGVPFVQVPTSLLAMADAAVGGKTAVNLPGGKNLVGSFHQPLGVYAEPRVLSTLPDADFVDGLAEVVKSAVIADVRLFRWLEAESQRLVARDPCTLEHALAACVRIKAAIVRRDERESGRRAVLNFGHTVAHAIEAASGFGERHGRSVAVGMCAEARLACDVTGFPERAVRRLVGLLEALGLPTRLPDALEVEDVVEATRHDKKTRAGRVRYALPLRLGRMPPGDDVTREVDPSALSETLRRS